VETPAPWRCRQLGLHAQARPRPGGAPKQAAEAMPSNQEKQRETHGPRIADEAKKGKDPQPRGFCWGGRAAVPIATRHCALPDSAAVGERFLRWARLIGRPLSTRQLPRKIALV
jgi:hypothetical protein